MIKERNFFLSIIKNYIDGRKTEADETVDWKKIFDYSRSHQLVPLVYHQCKNFIPADFYNGFKSESFAAIYSNSRRRKLTDKVFNALIENGVDCFLVKGFEIADFYPNWHYRSMGDTDIVVSDLEKAHSVLLNNGFQSTTKIKDREYQYFIDNMEFELHDRLVYEEAVNLDSTTEYLNNYKDYVSGGKINDSFHFIFVLNHLRKHFMNSGVGFRQFVDVAVLIKSNSNLDWNWIESELDKIGLLPFAKKVFYYIQRWFGVIAPIASEDVPENIFEESTDYIFKNGVFGFNNIENKDYLVSNTVRKSKYPKLAMIKSALQIVFPSYKTLVAVDKYSFLKGKPFLLPAAWIYRFFIMVRKKGINKAGKQLSESFVSKEYIVKREEMFSNWGL